MEYFTATFASHPIISALVCALVVQFLRGISFALRRLFFHPLSGFPGPRLAAITSLYKTYYEVVQGGELLKKVHNLHNKHGSVIRVGPNELHFNDYKAYHEIYSVESRFTKDPGFYNCFNTHDSTFGAIEPDESKARRGVMHSFFSHRAVAKLEDSMRQKIDCLICKLASRGRVPSNMFLAYRTATLDIITEYLFGQGQNNVDYPAFEAPLLIDIQTSVPILWLIKSFPWVLPILPYIPRWLASGIYDQYHAFISVQGFLVAWLTRTASEVGTLPGVEHSSICHSLLDPLTKPAWSSSSRPPFLDEVFSLIQAGSDTVGNTCTVGTFHILNDKRVHSRLTDELRSACVWPSSDDHVDIDALQALPYLTSVIKEALRLSHGFVTPLPRVVGPTGATIAGFEIPPNTIVGMSVTAVHLNPTLFPNPNSFVPERWLQPSSANLDRYLVSFSKGPRTCLGISMAWVELYIFFAYTFRKLDMELVDTSIDDFKDFKDYFIPVHTGKHLHVRAKCVE